MKKQSAELRKCPLPPPPMKRETVKIGPFGRKIYDQNIVWQKKFPQIRSIDVIPIGPGILLYRTIATLK